MKKNLIIKPMTVEDATAFVEHRSKSFLTPGMALPPISVPFSRYTQMDVSEQIKSVTASWSTAIGSLGWERAWGIFETVTTGDSRIVGGVALSTSRQIESQLHRAILGMGIEENYRNLGLGSNLLSNAISWAKEQKFLDWIDLGVFAHNAPARKLYRKFGFIETGRTVDCFRVDGMVIDDIHMTLELGQL